MEAAASPGACKSISVITLIKRTDYVRNRGVDASAEVQVPILIPLVGRDPQVAYMSKLEKVLVTRTLEEELSSGKVQTFFYFALKKMPPISSVS